METDLPAGAESSVPIATDQVHIPEPTPRQTPLSQEPPEPKAKSVSIDDAVTKAFDRAEKAAKSKVEPEPRAKAEPKEKAPEPEGKSRGEDGRFAPREPKEQGQSAPKTAEGAPAQAVAAPEGKPAEAGKSEARASHYEPPARFNDQGKAEWQQTPDSVKAEVHRAIKNLEDGYVKHKEGAERYEKFRQYDELAKQNGRDLSASLGALKQFEDTMRSNPLAAIDMALREAGPRKPDGSPLTINDVVAHLSGQSVDQRVQAAQARIHELETQIARVDMQRQLEAHVQEFMSAHPDFEQKADDLAFLIDNGFAPNLEAAYAFMDRFGLGAGKASSAPAAPPQASPAVDPATSAPVPPAPKPAGQKSISGAPSGAPQTLAGRKGKPPTIDEALERAFQRAS
jgi:hypothetical protein